MALRQNESPAFTNSVHSLDCFRPLHVKNGAVSNEGWVSNYTCFAKRAPTNFERHDSRTLFRMSKKIHCTLRQIRKDYLRKCSLI